MLKIYGKYTKVIQVAKYALVSFLLSINTFALATPLKTDTLVRWYKVYWSGIYVADLIASMENGRLTAKIETYGIAKAVSKYASLTHLEYITPGGTLTPVSYRTQFQQRHGARKVELVYNPKGDLASYSVIPPDPAWKRPKVPEDLRKDALDPLSAFLVAQKKIQASLENNLTPFSIDVFDGRALYKLDFKVYGAMQKKIGGVNYSVIKVDFQRKAVAGFTHRELTNMSKEEPLITVYLTNDGRLLPIKGDAEAPLGTAVLFFEKECHSLNECRPN